MVSTEQHRRVFGQLGASGNPLMETWSGSQVESIFHHVLLQHLHLSCPCVEASLVSLLTSNTYLLGTYCVQGTSCSKALSLLSTVLLFDDLEEKSVF